LIGVLHLFGLGSHWPCGVGGVNVLGHETHQTGVSVSQSHGAHQVDNTNLQKIPHPVATC
jgi:hypothetical protein